MDSRKNEITGLLLVNKPKGWTSNDVVQILKKKFKTKKVGHFGTLDPLATGLLVVGVGGCTKIEKCLDLDIKTYQAEVVAGIKTTTLDITGEIIEQNNQKIDKQTLIEALKKWQKTYLQTVPIYSAVKVNGKKLYEYARCNEAVTLPQKEVTILAIKFLEQTDLNHFSFEVTCSKGTYIRSLIKDISDDLGVLLTMSNLKRIRQGDFILEEAKDVNKISLKDLKLVDEILNVTKINLEVFDNPKLVISGNEISFSSFTTYILFLKEEKPLVLYGPSKKHKKMFSPVFFF